MGDRERSHSTVATIPHPDIEAPTVLAALDAARPHMRTLLDAAGRWWATLQAGGFQRDEAMQLLITRLAIEFGYDLGEPEE